MTLRVQGCAVLTTDAHKTSKVRAPCGGSKTPWDFGGSPWSVPWRVLTPPGAPTPAPMKGYDVMHRLA